MRPSFTRFAAVYVTQAPGLVITGNWFAELTRRADGVRLQLDRLPRRVGSPLEIA